MGGPQYYYLDKFNYDDFEFEEMEEEEEKSENYYNEEEEIDKKKAREKWIIRKAKNHKGLWLNETRAREYYIQAEKLRNAIRALTVGLKNTYELTETEAINIINGYHIGDYVMKYRKLKEVADEEKKKDKGNGKDPKC